MKVTGDRKVAVRGKMKRRFIMAGWKMSQETERTEASSKYTPGRPESPDCCRCRPMSDGPPNKCLGHAFGPSENTKKLQVSIANENNSSFQCMDVTLQGSSLTF